MQGRKDEIAAKRARLAEIKRQRELRQKELSNSRQSIGDPSDVRFHPDPSSVIALTDV